ncbi:MAG: hypothetical protein ABIQ18_20145 [Umezawaea sp.]
MRHSSSSPLTSCTGVGSRSSRGPPGRTGSAPSVASTPSCAETSRADSMRVMDLPQVE